MAHEELSSVPVKLETNISLYEPSSKKFTSFFFTLENSRLSYSLRKGLEVRKTYLIDSNVQILEQDPSGLIFQISEDNGKNSLKLKFNSAGEYSEWVKEIKIARRPRWEPESTKICNECKKEFTFFRRQHHCRNCGKVFCGDDSSSNLMLDELAYDVPVRVCRSCVTAINRKNASRQKAGELAGERKVDDDSPPLWEPKSSTNCSVCGDKFTFFNRQHHCRNCGKVVCNKHSQSYYILEKLGSTTPERVCDNCDRELGKS